MKDGPTLEGSLDLLKDGLNQSTLRKKKPCKTFFFSFTELNKKQNGADERREMNEHRTSSITFLRGPHLLLCPSPQRSRQARKKLCNDDPEEEGKEPMKASHSPWLLLLPPLRWTVAALSCQLLFMIHQEAVGGNTTPEIRKKNKKHPTQLEITFHI